MILPTDPAPYYRIHVFVCTNRRPDAHTRGSCAARGSEPLRDYLKARAKELGMKDIRVNSAGCLDRCELGPVMVIYPEGIWYSYHSHDDIDEILDTHLVKGGRVARLLLRPEDQPVVSA
ncbi:MAG: (2Fe-2S) ferredoxin domain-containing protein [Rhodospirillaceae bacterium]|nr:(2Fe-2S) ferredoxin domain-containing protein [Rhodospirillales bacterium]